MKIVVAAAVLITSAQGVFAQSAATYPTLSVDDGKMCAISLQKGGADWKQIVPPSAGDKGADIHAVVQAQDAFFVLMSKTIPVVSLVYDADKTDDYRLHPDGKLSWPSAIVYVYQGVWLKEEVKHQVRCVYEQDPWGLNLHTSVDDGTVAPPLSAAPVATNPPQKPKAKKSGH